MTPIALRDLGSEAFFSRRAEFMYIGFLDGLVGYLRSEYRAIKKQKEIPIMKTQYPHYTDHLRLSQAGWVIGYVKGTLRETPMHLLTTLKRYLEDVEAFVVDSGERSIKNWQDHEEDPWGEIRVAEPSSAQKKRPASPKPVKKNLMRPSAERTSVTLTWDDD